MTRTYTAEEIAAVRAYCDRVCADGIPCTFPGGLYCRTSACKDDIEAGLKELADRKENAHG